MALFVLLSSNATYDAFFPVLTKMCSILLRLKCAASHCARKSQAKWEFFPFVHILTKPVKKNKCAIQIGLI